MKFKRKISLMLASAVVLSSMASFSSLSQNVSAAQPDPNAAPPTTEGDSRMYDDHGSYQSYNLGYATDTNPNNDHLDATYGYGFGTPGYMRPYVYRESAPTAGWPNPATVAGPAGTNSANEYGQSITYAEGELHFVWGQGTQAYPTFTLTSLSDTGVFVGTSEALASALDANGDAHIKLSETTNSSIDGGVTPPNGSSDNNPDIFVGPDINSDGVPDSANETIWRTADLLTTNGIDLDAKISVYPNEDKQMVYQYDFTNTSAVDAWVGMVLGIDAQLEDSRGHYDEVPIYALPDHQGFYAGAQVGTDGDGFVDANGDGIDDTPPSPLAGQYTVRPYGGAMSGIADDPTTPNVDESGLLANPGPEQGQDGSGTGPDNWIVGQFGADNAIGLSNGYYNPFGGGSISLDGTSTTTGFGSDATLTPPAVANTMTGVGHETHTLTNLASPLSGPGYYDSAFNLKWQPTLVAPGATTTMTWAVELGAPGHPPVINDLKYSSTATTPTSSGIVPGTPLTSSSTVEVVAGDDLPVDILWSDVDSTPVDLQINLSGPANYTIPAGSHTNIPAFPAAANINITTPLTSPIIIPSSTIDGLYTCTVSATDPEGHASNKKSFKLDVKKGSTVTTDAVEVLEVINNSPTAATPVTYDAKVRLNGSIVEGDYPIGPNATDYGFYYTTLPNEVPTDPTASSRHYVPATDYVSLTHPDMRSTVVPILGISPTDSVKIVAYANTYPVTGAPPLVAYGNVVELDANSTNNLTATPKVYGLTAVNTVAANSPADTNHPNPYIKLTGEIDNMATAGPILESGFVYTSTLPTTPPPPPPSIDLTLADVNTTTVKKITSTTVAGPSVGATWTADITTGLVPGATYYVRSYVIDDNVGMQSNTESYGNLIKIVYTPNSVQIKYKFIDSDTGLPIPSIPPTTPPTEYTISPLLVPIGGSSGVINQPAVPGYTFDTAHPSTHPGFQNMTVNETVTFYYKSTTNITVTYHYINAGPNGTIVGLPPVGSQIITPPTTFQIPKGSALQPQTAPIIPGYDVLAPTQLPPTTISGAATQNDITITFNYKPRISSVAVQCYVGTPAVPSTVPVPGYTPVTIDALAGVPYTATAPVIPGYTLQGAVPTNGALSSVSMSTNTIKFYYLSDGTTPPPVTGGTTPPPVTGGGGGGGTTPPPVTGGGGGGIPGTGSTGGGGGGIPGTGGTGGGGGGIPGTGSTGGGGGGIPGTGGTGGGGGGIPGTGGTGGGGGGIPGTGSTGGGGGISPDFWNISGGGGIPTASNSNGGGGGTPSGGSSNGGGGISPDFWNISGGGGTPTASNSNGGGGTPSGGSSNGGGGTTSGSNSNGGGTSPDFWGISGGGGIPSATNSNGGGGTPGGTGLTGGTLAVNIDTDGNGTPDINIDTDGNGTPDVNIDTNGNKIPDVNVDTDGNGTPDVNIDTNGNRIPDLNVDTDGNGTPDLNVDTDGNKIPNINVDTDGDGTPDINIDTNGNKIPDVNIDTDGNGKPDLNIDTNGNKIPDVNVDTNGDGKPDVNIDTDGNGKPDLNIDTNGDGKPDVNIDTNGDGKPDVNIDTNANATPNVSNVGGSTSSTSTATNGTDVPNVPTGAPFGVVAACAILALAGGTLIITRRKK